ncbi:MAG TPA: phosphatidylglycerophosphatase A [Oligoflexus sp.]|uniref:phosphatidylglycerophosphatase A family protein n=1 Tax=Oligoflexus sp. TaxID=1971216 RepID=UPI002D551CF8|nr:phosphatidylglycerophosphatase A [Oligoflexus sp.]HYX32260.1 phosphatidylglycerophosphatase A [Oligoflexus sp.]
MKKSQERGPVRLNFWSSLAVAFPLGLAPKAPGTFGSLAGIPVGIFFFNYGHTLAARWGWSAWLVQILLLSLLGILSWWCIERTEKFWNTHDDGRIVIDEVLGQAIPLSFIAADWKIVLAAFALFRFFDIVKPGPIGWADRELPGAWGTLIDDVIAGIFAWAVLASGHALFLFLQKPE